MAQAKTATEQVTAMNMLAEKAASLPIMARMEVAAQLMAAQLTLNEMIVNEIEALKKNG
jgi:hypothetical protein